MKELRIGGTIIYRTKQVCAYADDIELVGRNLDWLMEMFDILEEKSRALGLRINEGKTKYMKMSSLEDRGWTPTVTLGKYTFERVKDFIYLGTNLNSKNMVTEEISRRILAGNRAYFANMKLLKSTQLSRYSKVQLYKTHCDLWSGNVDHVSG
jgi:sorting nexin-29